MQMHTLNLNIDYILTKFAFVSFQNIWQNIWLDHNISQQACWVLLAMEYKVGCSAICNSLPKGNYNANSTLSLPGCDFD